MSQPAYHIRLMKDLKAFQKDPPPNIHALPDPDNILEWHYVITGPENTPYHGGYYHGKVVFPSAYPHKPPSIYIITPNGRFSTNIRLCLSMSDYHPETWNPLWSVSSILTGLLSFMLENGSTAGSISTSYEQKRKFAQKSMNFNKQNPKFKQLFPDFMDKEFQPMESDKYIFTQSPSPPTGTTNIWVSILIIVLGSFFVYITY